ncbi:MAG: hypothetical protein WA584_03845 [Pyrinomonadaceae bacterium]
MLIETVAAYIALEIASGFLKEHGKEIYHKAKGLLTPGEITTLGLLEQYPDSQKLQGEVAAALETHLQSNPAAAEELSELVNQLKAASNKTSYNYQQGETNINIQNSEGSRIDLNKK